MRAVCSTTANGHKGGGGLVVAGSLAQRSDRGGHCWFFGQWLIGLRRLGWDVFFIDYEDADAALSAQDRDRLAGAMHEFGFAESYALLTREGSTGGRSRADAVEKLRQSEALINVMGFLQDEELLAASARRLFLDIDPGYGQIWRELGLADILAGHDDFITVGSNVGRPDCDVPDSGVEWISTLPPVVLDEWPRRAGGTSWTTVATWRGPWGPLEYGANVLGSRVHEFRKFASLPTRVASSFEIALDIHEDEWEDIELLQLNGWSLVEPSRVARDPNSYRNFVQRSRAEFCVAKQIYVETRSGWFSDRSACYLASGKPVLAQETGFTDVLPAGEGLIAFATPEDAADGVEQVERDYERHVDAAREIAEAHLDSDRVLGGLLERLGVG